MMARRRYGRGFGGSRGWWGRGGEPVPLLLAPQDPPLLLVMLVELGRVLRRYRSELVPVFVLGAAFGLAWWLRLAYPAWWPVPAVLGVGAAVVALVGPARWLGSWSTVPERVYFAAVAISVGCWISAAAAYGPTRGVLPTVAVGLTVGLGVPWWFDHRRRARVTVSRKVDRWPELAELAGIRGVRILSFRIEPWGWIARLALRGATTVRQVADACAALESGLDTRPGAVRVEPDPKRASRATLRVVECDPHAEPIPWPGPSSRRGSGDRSIRDAIEVGVFEDADPVRVRLRGRHVLVGGTTGAGKSGVINVLLAGLSGCADIALWGIDLKGGMELRPWASCLATLATTGAQAVDVLQAGVREVGRRATAMAAQGARVWNPTPAHPAVVLVIDEYAELPDPARQLADSIARRGRAVDVTLLVATQRPTQAAMGHGAVRSQMDVRICLRVREKRDADLILGHGAVANGWWAHQLTAPGSFLISSPDHPIPRRARAYLLTDHDVNATAQQHRRPAQPTTGDHDREEHDSRAAGPAPRLNPTHPKPEAARPHAVESPEVPTGDNPHREVIDPDRALLAALRNAPPDGATITDLTTACGMSRSWTYYRLADHARNGHANQVSRGRWRLADPTPP